MTFPEFEQLMEQTFDNLRGLCNTKGKEYAHDADRFANFKRLSAELQLAPDKVLWVYLKKHLDSIVHHINTKESLSEPIDGRIDDAVNYLLLLKGLWRDMAKEQEH
jgi:hypothetical protein